MQRHRFFGALDAVTGEWHWADHDRKLAVHFVAFLKQVVAAYPTGVLYLALDSAPAHTAKVVEKWLVANPRVKQGAVAAQVLGAQAQPCGAGVALDEGQRRRQPPGG